MSDLVELKENKTCAFCGKDLIAGKFAMYEPFRGMYFCDIRCMINSQDGYLEAEKEKTTTRGEESL